MLRGSKVRINEKANPPHLRGREGIVLERLKNHPNFIKVLQRVSEHQGGWLTDLNYPEDNLDVIEPPVEI